MEYHFWGTKYLTAITIGSTGSNNFSPCGCCGGAGGCQNCANYLSTAADCFLNNFQPSCFQDQFGSIYSLTVNGWLAPNGNLITYNCADGHYYINGVIDVESPFRIGLGIGVLCVQPPTCCDNSEYVDNVYLHLTSTNCPGFNQVILANLYPGTNGSGCGSPCQSPIYYLPAYTFNDLPGTSWLSCNTSLGYGLCNWNLYLTFLGESGTCLFNLTTNGGGSLISTIPIIANPFSTCSPIDIQFDSTSDMSGQYWIFSGTTTGSNFTSFVGCCNSLPSSVPFTVTGGGFGVHPTSIDFNISGLTNSDICPCCSEFNGSYSLVRGGGTLRIGNYGASSGAGGTIPNANIDAGVNIDDTTGAVTGLSIANINCSGCDFHVHVTESSMHMFGQTSSVPTHIEELLKEDLTLDQRIYLLNRVNNGTIPKPVEQAPGILSQIKSLGKAVITEAIHGGDLNEQEREYRLKKCNSCEYLTEDRKCSQCMCPVDSKISYSTEQCPLLFWLATKYAKKPEQIIKMNSGCGGCGKK